MSGPYRPFDPAELRIPGEADPSHAELAEALTTARELEALAVSAGIRPTDGFEDRVMAAIAAEPAPRLVVRPGSQVRGGRLGAFVLAFRDAWGVASTGGRPFAVRAQALAFVLIVALAAGSLVTAGAVTVGSLLARPSGPTPSLRPAPTTTRPRPTPPSRPRRRNPRRQPNPPKPPNRQRPQSRPDRTTTVVAAALAVGGGGGETARPTRRRGRPGQTTTPATAAAARQPDPPRPRKPPTTTAVAVVVAAATGVAEVPGPG